MNKFLLASLGLAITMSGVSFGKQMTLNDGSVLNTDNLFELEAFLIKNGRSYEEVSGLQLSAKQAIAGDIIAREAVSVASGVVASGVVAQKAQEDVVQAKETDRSAPRQPVVTTTVSNARRNLLMCTGAVAIAAAAYYQRGALRGLTLPSFGSIRSSASSAGSSVWSAAQSMGSSAWACASSGLSSGCSALWNRIPSFRTAKANTLGQL
jgi:hypothetical protein